MLVMSRWAIFFILFAAGRVVQAQDTSWTLQRSIEYALAHNLEIKQNELNERLARLQWQQGRLSQLPSASLSSNMGRSYGRSIDPTTNQFINQGYTFAGLGGNIDVLLFGWFQKRNTIRQYRHLAASAAADLDQLKDDISLNVATAFLRILLAREQVRVNEQQLQLSREQNEQTALFVKVGRSPDLDMAQMEAQLATDSAGLIAAINDYQLAILDIKAILNFEIATPFFADAPAVTAVQWEEAAQLKPEDIYAIAEKQMGVIRSNQLQIYAAEREMNAAKASLYPQLSLGAQLGTNFSSNLKEISGFRLSDYRSTGNIIVYNNEVLQVQEPVYNFDTRTTPWLTQFNNNFRQTVALNLTVPLFNGWSTRAGMERARVNVQGKQLAMEQARLKLKQDVYKAFYDMQSAMQKYRSTERAAQASERAWQYAEKRYELGLMNALELLTTKNNFFKASSEALSAKYDMIFKLKVIDYYTGKAIKL